MDPSSGGFVLPALTRAGGVMAGDIHMNGHKLTLDADKDSYLYSPSDDILDFYTGAAQTLRIASTITAYKELLISDAIPISLGASRDADVRWDTAEATDTLKWGLKTGAFIIGPDDDRGVDRYGGAPPPALALVVRADTVTPGQRLDIYQSANESIIQAVASNLQLKVGALTFLHAKASTGDVRHSRVQTLMQTDVATDGDPDKDSYIYRFRASSKHDTGTAAADRDFTVAQVVDATSGGPGTLDSAYLDFVPPTGFTAEGLRLWNSAEGAGEYVTLRVAAGGASFLDSAGGDFTIRRAGATRVKVAAASVELSVSLVMLDALDFVFQTTTGTKIGTAANQKIGFFGHAPVVQAAKASYNNWAAFGDVVDALVDLGLFDAA